MIKDYMNNNIKARGFMVIYGATLDQQCTNS